MITCSSFFFLSFFSPSLWSFYLFSFGVLLFMETFISRSSSPLPAGRLQLYITRQPVGAVGRPAGTWAVALPYPLPWPARRNIESSTSLGWATRKLASWGSSLLFCVWGDSVPANGRRSAAADIRCSHASCSFPCRSMRWGPSGGVNLQSSPIPRRAPRDFCTTSTGTGH